MTFQANAAARYVRVAATNPESALEDLLKQTQSENDREILLAVDFDFCEYWRDEKKSVALVGLFHIVADSIAVGVIDAESFNSHEKRWRERALTIAEWLAILPTTLMSLEGAMPLQPISIPKPWGQEIWYTGIEKRGVAKIGVADRSVPLPWLLAVAPQRLTRGELQPILLKILDPLPEPVFGDLYFELHREKQEVYVVTAIDRDAWPDGVGAIRFGFDAQRRAEFGDDTKFLEAYLDAVREYRSARVQIDARIDELRTLDGIGLHDPVSAAVLARWLDEVDPVLRQSETALRLQMESFTALRSLRVGDVVKVPCLLPHSLQHGVRTVEFQTPVYERLILSFAQKVLTQSQWDTDEALGVLQLDPEPQSPFPVLEQGDGWRTERIVGFDDFEVQRIIVKGGKQMPLNHKHRYALGMAVGDGLTLGRAKLHADDALFLAANFQSQILNNESDEDAYFLLALPIS